MVLDGWVLVLYLSVFILSSSAVGTQWVGWLFSVIGTVSCGCILVIKIEIGFRTLMEFMYLIFSMRGMYNWLVI